MSGGRAKVGWALVAMLTFLSAATVAQVPDRLLARNAIRYLGLTPEQVSAMNVIHASWLDYRALAAERAGRIESLIAMKTRDTKGAPIAHGQQNSGLEAICLQSHERREKAMIETRALLKPVQIAQLATLEQAITLMPIVESAESVNLLSGTLRGPPAGMPDGTIEVEFGYTRTVNVPLPGCRKSPQVIRPGTEFSKDK